MVGEPERRRRLVDAVAAVYDWIDLQQRRHPDRAGCCETCGACCDFVAYDHRLFVTPPELIYLAAKLDAEGLEAMTGRRCPYQQGKRCTVHEHRFAGCRIFCCKGDPDFQSELSEVAMKKLKAICNRFDVPYRYSEMSKALSDFTGDTSRWAEAPGPEGRAD